MTVSRQNTDGDRDGSVIFITNAGLRLGGGHVMRCMALAERLTGAAYDCAFVTGKDAADFMPQLRSLGEHWKPVAFDAGDAAALARSIEPVLDEKAELIVIDHPELDTAFETSARELGKRIAVFDDGPSREHDCDVLIDLAVGTGEADYAGKVPERCHMMLGPAYAPLRPGFRQLRRHSLARREDGTLKRVFVGFGATDPNGATLVALEAIAASGLSLRVDIVLGGAENGVTARVLEAVEMHGGEWRLHRNAEDVAAIMSDADVAIGAAGGMSWERCALGLPAIVLVQAENQRPNAEALSARRAAIVIGDRAASPAEELANALRGLAGEPEALRRMSVAASQMADGSGAGWLAAGLGLVGNDKGERVALRPQRGSTLQSGSETNHADQGSALILQDGHVAGSLEFSKPTMEMRPIECDADALSLTVMIDDSFAESGVGGAALRLLGFVFPEAVMRTTPGGAPGVTENELVSAGFNLSGGAFVRPPVACVLPESVSEPVL